MDTKDERKWYAVFVTTGEEDKVKERIHFRMYDELKALVPKRRMRERKEGKWQERIRPLFPGYVLLNGQINNRTYNLISDIPGVIRLLKDTNGPQEIHENEIWVLLRLMAENEVIGSSKLYVQDEKIKVIEGPLMGLEGYIKAVNKRKGRVKVFLSLMGEPRIVELCITMVQPA
ncbi:antiterminator LoaP [Ruminiclostridium herbifermentans]|uniref:Transcription termination/antitermination protein NusG n=1 Tax=Ruminiclostridium herbifermentans TaxID=2488810 RepID=A0A4U7JG51_9FIRM|nr:antiterminator LoaP [Ruminiclostridium herbifermentans]QNU66630.1 antiterminator LoaP [Ruminiclostridium herbifermentans]